MTNQPSSIDLYKSKKEHISIDKVYCFGVLDNKHFLVMRETREDNEVYIRWQKNQNTRFSGQNVFGLRAEKLLKMIISKLPKNQLTEQVIAEMETMIEKNKKAAETSNQLTDKEPKQQIRTEEQIKREKDFKKFMENKEIFAAKNEERKKAKELEKQAKAAQREEEKRLRQEAAQKRIQEQKTLKELKNQEQAYIKMMLTANDQTPVVISANDTNIILGYLDNKFYRIKMTDNQSTFYSVSDNKLEPMSVETLHKIIMAVDENCNQNSQYDNLLTNIVTAFAEFNQTAKAIEKKTLKERVAISKNILIQKGILNNQNTL